ncbi:MAG: hypothetical protein V4672_14835 [Verrucomicrobiota bacterium]
MKPARKPKPDPQRSSKRPDKGWAEKADLEIASALSSLEDELPSKL